MARESNGTHTADEISGINLGIGTGTDAGRNTFAKNGLTGFCVLSSVAKAAANLSLRADGNIFGSPSTGDCTKGGKYKHGSSCVAGLDYAGACSAAVTLTNCTGSNACQ